MSVKFANCAKERIEMLYRLCLQSSFNKIDFQRMNSIYEHLSVEIVVLYISNSLL